jgi:PEP-CTERM motif
MTSFRKDASMITAKKYFFAAVLVAVLLIATSSARADYISIGVPLNSQYAGQNVGDVVAQANNGSSTVNGVLPGQIRLTYAVYPVPAYTQNGPNIGFTSVAFNTDLPIRASQVTGPSDWLVSPPAFPAFGGVSPVVGGSTPAPWEMVAPNSSSAAGDVVVLISGLGSSATLNHLLFSLPVNLSAPPSTFSGAVAFQGAGTVSVDTVFGSPVAGAPEPGSVTLALVGLAGAAGINLVRRRRSIRR